MKPLIKTNPYLKDPATRRKLLKRSAVTSCAVEGIKDDDDFSCIKHIKISRHRTKRLYKQMLKERSSK